MPPELRKEFAHAFERVKKMEGFDAAAGALGNAILDTEDDRGPVELLDHAARDDADHAAMPAFAPEHQGGIVVGDGRFDAAVEDFFDDGAFSRLPLNVQGEELACDPRGFF